VRSTRWVPVEGSLQLHGRVTMLGFHSSNRSTYQRGRKLPVTRSCVIASVLSRGVVPHREVGIASLEP
jgi:hypothetical protein